MSEETNKAAAGYGSQPYEQGICLRPGPISASVTTVSHLLPCLWPGVYGQPSLCCGLCCRCVCFQGCQTSGAPCREEWHRWSLASFHAGGPLPDGSWTSIWAPVDTNQTPHYNLVYKDFITIKRSVNTGTPFLLHTMLGFSTWEKRMAKVVLCLVFIWTVHCDSKAADLSPTKYAAILALLLWL